MCSPLPPTAVPIAACVVFMTWPLLLVWLGTPALAEEIRGEVGFVIPESRFTRLTPENDGLESQFLGKKVYWVTVQAHCSRITKYIPGTTRAYAEGKPQGPEHENFTPRGGCGGWE